MFEGNWSFIIPKLDIHCIQEVDVVIVASAIDLLL